MTLSIKKLEYFLNNNSLISKKYFTVNNECVYIEIFNLQNSNTFLLYIPSKFIIKPESSDNVHKITYIEIQNDNNISTDYSGEIDNFDLESQYNEIDLNNSISSQDNNKIVEKLEEDYNHPLLLKKINIKDNKELREIIRQLKRLKFCVSGMNYKISILYKNYLCNIKKTEDIEIYAIDNFPLTSKKILLVNIDLLSLYDKINTLSTDITTIKNGIYKILNKNDEKHTYNLQKIIETNMTIFSVNILDKKKKYYNKLIELEKLFEQLLTSEEKIIEKINDIKQKFSSENSIKGLHTDIQRSRMLSKYETELSQVYSLKKEITNNILIVKTNYENISLNFDNIIFDNIVMINAIIKNLNTLSYL